MKRAVITTLLLCFLFGCARSKERVLKEEERSQNWVAYSSEKGTVQCSEEMNRELTGLISSAKGEEIKETHIRQWEAHFKFTTIQMIPFQTVSASGKHDVSDLYRDLLVSRDGYLWCDGKTYYLGKTICGSFIDLFNNATAETTEKQDTGIIKDSLLSAAEDSQPQLFADMGLSSERLYFLNEEKKELLKSIAEEIELKRASTYDSFIDHYFSFERRVSFENDHMYVDAKAYKLNEKAEIQIRQLLDLLNDEEKLFLSMTADDIETIRVFSDEEANAKEMNPEQKKEFLQLLNAAKYYSADMYQDGMVGDSPLYCRIVTKDGSQYLIEAYRWFININHRTYNGYHYCFLDIRNFLAAFLKTEKRRFPLLGSVFSILCLI